MSNIAKLVKSGTDTDGTEWDTYEVHNTETGETLVVDIMPTGVTSMDESAIEGNLGIENVTI